MAFGKTVALALQAVAAAEVENMEDVNVSEEIKKSAEVKPGWKTTEFWVTGVLPQVPAVLTVILGAANPVVIAAGAVCSIIYALARTSHKSSVAKSVAWAAVQAAGEAAKNAPQGK